MNRVSARFAPDAESPGLGAALELAALGLGLVLVTAAMTRLPSWYRELGSFQVLYAAGFAFYATALMRLRRYAALPHAGVAVFAVAAACRLLLTPLAPSLSGDLYRYVWEGRVWLAGGNPYRQAPLDPTLVPLRDAAIYPFVNHPQLATIYPPLAQAGFALVAWISPTVLAFKVWVALHDLALAAVLGAWTSRERGSGAWALAYAWNPLVLVEYAGSGHNDPTAMLGLALALALRERRPVLSSVAFAWGTLAKLAPLVALPFLWRDWPWRARLAAATLLVPGLAWFVWQTHVSYSGLAVYWGTWRNNELLFLLFDRAFGSFRAARAVTLALVMLVVAVAWWRRRPPASATRGGLWAALVTSPVVHPWYAGWVLMFEPLRVSAPWIVFSLLLALNYGFGRTPAEGRSFHPPLAWRWIEYGVPLVLAMFLAWRGRGRSPAGGEADVP
jgi:hypothetical protein